LHELTDTTYTQNSTTVGVVVENKKMVSPNVLFVYSSRTKMYDNDDWLSNIKTWKKWIRIGDGESLSYAGIDFHKPIDEEQLVKEIKRRKTLDNRKLEDNRRQVTQKKEHRISRSFETIGK
jgi:hypothetical protein